MKLYHGTSEQAATAAMAEGLLPRSRTKKSNWSHSVSSHPDAVYLTDAYPIYFAVSAIDKSTLTPDNPGVRAAVLEIETDLLPADALVPDEDVLEQSSRESSDRGNRGKMRRRTLHFRNMLQRYRGTDGWRRSLEAMGTCAHLGPIPPQAITRVAFVDLQKQAKLCLAAMDATISLAHYQLCGHLHRCMTAHLFGEPAPATANEIDRMMATHSEWLRRISRNGIEVLHNTTLKETAA